MTQAPTGTPAPRAPWYSFATPTIGKGVRWASRITHHGGSAFPGKVVERVDPGFLRRTLAQLPLGVVLVSGTNGKTTTTAPTGTPAPRAPWYAFATPTIGKGVRWASRITHHGGSAFPGKVVERVDPGFLRRTLAQLPLGVVLVSGTNGKTTTTRMVSMMLESLGLRVFTNPTGSNFTSVVVSARLQELSADGAHDADIAVLELDEAYAVQFVEQVRPDYALLLNVMRDQLDRFGEFDNTARLLSRVAAATTGTVVLNREDPRIAALAQVVPSGARTVHFGL